MIQEILGNKVEIGVGSSTGNPDFKGVQTRDIREWVRINDEEWYLIRYACSYEEWINSTDIFLLSLRLSAATGRDIFENEGKLSFGQFNIQNILR